VDADADDEGASEGEQVSPLLEKSV
jgi:hypothetical protein